MGYTIGNLELGSRNLLYYNRQWAFLHLFSRETLFLSSSTETAQKKKTISASLTKHVEMKLMESCLPKGWRICHHLQVTESLSPTLFISPYLPPILPWTSINRLKKNALCCMDVKKIYPRFFRNLEKKIANFIKRYKENMAIRMWRNQNILPTIVIKTAGQGF